MYFCNMIKEFQLQVLPEQSCKPKLLTNIVAGKLQIEEVEITHEVATSVSLGNFVLRRYKTQHIRIFEGDEISTRSSKEILRVINKESNLGHTEEEFKKKNTRVIGREIIEQLLEKEQDK